MIPITRKELYLNKIVGNNDYETPEKPITIEEFFFAEILGEAVQAPEPLTRYQIYLAKIAGREIEIPYPETRLEYFLAKAAGMDISTPVPITKEEIYWSNYTAIVEFEFEGVPPLTFNAVAGSLKNYRIYGNTFDGESVGDLVNDGEHAGEYKVPVTVSNGTDTQTTPIYLPEPIKMVGDEAEYIDYGEQKQHRVRVNLSEVNEFSNSITDTSNTLNIWVQQGKNDSFVYPPQQKIFVITEPTAITTSITITNDDDSIRIKHNGSISDIVIDIVRGLSPGAYSVSFNVLNYDHTTVGGLVINNIMVNKGSTALPYEPYIENTDLDVTLPALPTVTGTNTLSFGTAVQPSKVYIKGDEAEYIDYAEQKQHVDADEEIEKQATTYMVSITPQTDVSKIVFVTMSSVPDDCTILTSGLIFTLNEADANTLNSTNYADGVRGKASTAHSYRYTWTKGYTEGETYYIRSYVKYQTADNEIKEVYGDVYKADINGFERVRKNLLPNTATSQTINTELDVTLPALPTLTGTNVLSVGTEVKPSKVYIKGEKEREYS